jgi:hypothetical protein
MKRAWLTPTTISGLLIVYSGLYLWQPGGAEALLVVTHVLFAVFALLASILALKASQMFEPGVASRRVWLCFGAGMTALTISELLWLVYYFLGQPIPYPSIVDISWGIGFISVLASLVLQYRALGVQISRRIKLLVLAAYLGVLVVILGLLLSHILANPGEVAVMQLLVSAYYLIGDLGVAFLATLTLVYFGKGLVGRPWRYMLISILLFAAGGLAFSYGTWTSTYVTGSNFLSMMSDVGYLSAYLLAAAGGYSQLTLRLPAVDEEE